jgi:hypothetical protein
MARLESPLGVEDGLVEPSPEFHRPEGLYVIAAARPNRSDG